MMITCIAPNKVSLVSMTVMMNNVTVLLSFEIERRFQIQIFLLKNISDITQQLL